MAERNSRGILKFNGGEGQKNELQCIKIYRRFRTCSIRPF